MTPADRILQALREQGECSRGDLLDAAGSASYPELDALLNPLIQSGQITAHWHDAGFRSYRLAVVERDRPRHSIPPWLHIIPRK